MNSVRSNNVSLKYRRFTPSGYAKIQILDNCSLCKDSISLLKCCMNNTANLETGNNKSNMTVIYMSEILILQFSLYRAHSKILIQWLRFQRSVIDWWDPENQYYGWIWWEIRSAPPQKKTSRLSLSFLETFQNQNEVYLFDKILTIEQRLSRNNEYCTTNSILVDKICHKQYLSPKHLPQTVS